MCVARGNCWRSGTRIVYQAGKHIVIGTYNGRGVTARVQDMKRTAKYIDDGKYQATQVSRGVRASTAVNIFLATISAPSEVFAFGTVVAVCPYGVGECWDRAHTTARP